jgi:hypothetical protein
LVDNSMLKGKTVKKKLFFLKETKAPQVKPG